MKAGAERISHVLGNMFQTVDRDYLDRHSAYDCENTFDTAEEAIVARKRKESGPSAENTLEKLRKDYERRERLQ